MKKALVVCHMGRHYRKFGHYDINPLQELGYEVHFAANFTLDIDKVSDDSLKLHQVDFQRSPFSLKNINAYKQIKKIIKEGNYDIIHCQSPVGGALTRVAFKNIKQKKGRIIYTAHGFHFYKGAPLLNWMLFYPVEKYLSKYTDTLITINQEDYELAKRKFKKCKDIQYVPGVGIDSKKFEFIMNEPPKKKLRKSLGLKDKDFVMIYPARLDKNKNQIFLINAMEKLVNKNKNIKLLLPGIDDLNGYYQNIVKNKNLENNIIFLGYRNDISKLLKISNIAVSSSKREGLPINILEAMCCGLPVVALNCRGMSDLIKNGRNGYIVNSEQEFIDSVLLIYQNDIHDSLNKTNNQVLFDYSMSNVNKKMKQFFSSN